MGRSVLMKSIGQLVQAVIPLAVTMVINCLSGEEMMQRRRIGLFIAKENITGNVNGFRNLRDQNIEMQTNILAKAINNGTMKTKTLLKP